MNFSDDYLNSRYAKKFNVPKRVIEVYNEKYGNFGKNVTLDTLTSNEKMESLLNKLRVCKIIILKDNINETN